MEQITVCIPAHNNGRGIVECMESVRKQKGAFKVIISDDASTDNTAAVVSGYIRDNNLDWRFISDNYWLGCSLRRKFLLDLVDTPFVFFMDADDYLIEDTVMEKVTPYLDGYDLIWINIDNDWGRHNEFTGNLWHDLSAGRIEPRINNVYKTELLRSVEWFPEQYGEVVYISQAVMCQKPRCFFLPDKLYKWRNIGESVTSKMTGEEAWTGRFLYSKRIWELMNEHKDLVNGGGFIKPVYFDYEKYLEDWKNGK